MLDPLPIEALSGTRNWVAARRGCLGASRMIDVLAVSKRDGTPLKARQDLMMELVAERMTGIAIDHYVSPAMQWGIDHEPEAVENYEIETGTLTTGTGWILHPRIEYFGATPDRVIHPRGLLEVKCPTTPKFVEWLRAGVVPDEHKPQMVAQLACTRREWVDFVAFDPRVKRGRNLFIRRFTATIEEIALIESAAINFLQEVEHLFTAVVTA